MYNLTHISHVDKIIYYIYNKEDKNCSLKPKEMKGNKKSALIALVIVMIVSVYILSKYTPQIINNLVEEDGNWLVCLFPLLIYVVIFIIVSLTRRITVGSPLFTIKKNGYKHNMLRAMVWGSSIGAILSVFLLLILPIKIACFIGIFAGLLLCHIVFIIFYHQ